jgi:diacylglycerol kinase
MKRFFRSFSYALAGLRAAVKTEQSFRLHLLAMVVAIGIGIYDDISMASWGIVLLSIGLVLAAELFNTALERLGDGFSGGAYNEFVKREKDASAAAVLVTATAALAVGVIFLISPLIQKVSGN